MSIAINSVSVQSSKALSSESQSGGVRLAWQVGIWSSQILLFLAFGPVGLMKTFMSPEALVAMGLGFARTFPIGCCASSASRNWQARLGSCCRR